MAKQVRPKAGKGNSKAGVQRKQRIAPSFVAAEVAQPAFTPPPIPGPSAEAVAVYEAAMSDLQRHNFVRASQQFGDLIAGFPLERALLDRARVYVGICERELRRQPLAPSTVEERVTAATAALNNDDDASAEALARGVLDDVPDHDLALYLLAAVSARRGETDEAVALLSRAAVVTPEVRAQARHDADFESLRDLDAFRLLIDPPVQATAAPAASIRRVRRGR